MNRVGKWLTIVLVAGAVSYGATAQAEPVEVMLDYIARKAELRARAPFHSPRADLPAVLRADKLDYDNYREIEFRRDKALWAAEGLPFRVEFFHPGYLYEEPIHVNVFTRTNARPLPFEQAFFNYRALTIQKQIPTNTGYAGFKLLCPLNSPDRWDELGAVMGASYFRLLGKWQRYGLSARGLALDCGELDRPEEFPILTDWWLGKPERGEHALRLYAILDSVSCAGAYGFVIRPGETTVVDIEAVLFLREPKEVLAVNPQRKPLKTLGLAPLTSMFWFGAASERKFVDYRPAVHDSDGLLMRMDKGEVLWRPLVDPTALRHQQFATTGLRGFGLLQRDRNFSTYQDLFNEYERVPSVWVEPRGRWGDGEIHLVELATEYEGLDNIVAFWDPKEKPKPMQPYRFAYTLYWTRETDRKLSENPVLATRVGLAPKDPRQRQFALDFGGPALSGLTEKTPPEAIANCSTNAGIVENQVFYNPHARTWRVMLKVEPKARNTYPVDLRCILMRDGKALSETWTYHWSP